MNNFMQGVAIVAVVLDRLEQNLDAQVRFLPPCTQLNREADTK